jgi:hypothetical protein
MLIKRFMLMALLGILLSACTLFGGAPAAVTPTLNSIPTSTNSPAPSPTETALPPTATITPTLTPTPTATPAYPEEGFGPMDFPENVNPLTGMFVANPNILDRRPVAFKVNIVPRTSTRPPWGLSLADIVFDYYHNDGYSRFHAIFYGNSAAQVGPIRSARLPDDLLVRMYKSIFAYGGADAKISSRLFSGDYTGRLVLEGGRRSLCPPTPAAPLCRHDPNGYDFLLGGTEEIHAFAAAEGINDLLPNLDGMFFQMQAPQEGTPGAQVTTRYSGDSYNRWEFDPVSETYLRFQDNIFDEGQGEAYAPLLDRLNNEQISAANVVVLLAPHEYFQRPPADIVEILLTGTGQAYAFRDGQAYEVSWTRSAPESILSLTLPDGSPYPFKPGNTWFQIIGQFSVITQTEEDSWRFEFRIP